MLFQLIDIFNGCQVWGARLEKRGVHLTGIYFDNREMAERGKVLSRLSNIYPGQICQPFQASHPRTPNLTPAIFIESQIQ